MLDKFKIAFNKTENKLLDIKQSLTPLLTDKKFLIALALLFALFFSIRVFYISKKVSFFIDEVYSIELSNRSEYGLCNNKIPTDVKYTGKQLKQLQLWNDDSISDSLNDVFHLWIDNKDSPHTNFYYSFLRLWFTGVKSIDNKYITNRGCALNLLFFSISFLLMVVLLSKLTSNKIYILLCLLIAFCNPGTISSTLFIRPYELQQTMFIAFTLLFVTYLKAIIKQNNIFTKKNLFKSALIISLTMLAGYFGLFYIAILGLILLILLYKNKNYNVIKYFIFMFLLSLLLAKGLYLSFGEGLFSYRGKEALGKINGNEIISNIKLTLVSFDSQIMKNNILIYLSAILSIICCIKLTVDIIRKKTKTFSSYCSVLTIASCFFFVILTLYFTPYKDLRYIAPTFPLFSILFVNNIWLKKKYNYLIPLLIVFCYAIAIMPMDNIAKGVRTGYSTIEHIDDDFLTKTFIEKTKIPLAIHNNDCRSHIIIPYIKNEQSVYLFDNFDEHTINEKHYYVFLTPTCDPKLLEKYKDNIVWEFPRQLTVIEIKK